MKFVMFLISLFSSYLFSMELELNKKISDLSLKENDSLRDNSNKTVTFTDLEILNHVKIIAQKLNKPEIYCLTLIDCENAYRILAEEIQKHKRMSQKIFNQLIASEDSLNIIEKFILAGIDVNYLNCKRKIYLTPLMIAAKHNKKEIVKLLLRHGADKKIVNNSKKAAIDYAQADVKKLFNVARKLNF